MIEKLLRSRSPHAAPLRAAAVLGLAVLLIPVAAAAQDADGDSILDANDNCINVPNLLQIDTDCDGYGNACDADFDQNGIVNAADLALFSPGVADQLLDVATPFNGVTDAADEAMILATSGSAPGPAGASPISPSCAPLHLAGPHYCLAGTASGSDYAWEISGSGVTTFAFDPVPGVPAGANGQILMLHIQSSIDSVAGSTGVGVTGVSFTPEACFSLSNPNAALTVGPAGNPTQCAVTGAGCIYNPIIYRRNPGPNDQDGDGVVDGDDNCTVIPNPLQLDGDCDGYGNACDADFNNDLAVNLVDLNAVIAKVGAADAQMDVTPPFSGVVEPADVTAVQALLGTAPGPSALNPAAPSPSCTARTLSGSHYCVTGTATGADYAWSITSSSGLVAVEDPVPGLPPGASSQTLMLNLQSRIQGQYGNVDVQVAEVALTPNACFALTDPLSTVTVGPAGNPTQCTVTTAGCTFNPTVYQVLAAVPTLSPGALAGLVAAIGGAPAVWMAMRRRRTRGARP